ncbi:hypothetical protein VOI54_17225 [Tamlana sp. 2201CG12-4]|uniref:hypothetical protein n=1 Tax=Tamlana sp. 2201CG12-4 TaxID=3112582 RepID=UPI002DB797DC|nr:hypothetical protein [Tamlana sp. 2201CG12-4]MEC3908773.1 hypothetical protein [Tamlana sp. 2201CG12-4]
MKKLTYIILGFIIGAVLTYYFCPRPVEMQTSETKIVKPNGVISIDKAKELNNNWTDYRQAAVDSAAQKQGRKKDDRSVFWSIEDIENYLVYAKNQTDSLGYDMSGIRIYLGVYGENAGQLKKNLTTMFIVPTISKQLAQASMNPMNMGLQNGGDCPECSPLNAGSGGNGGYPQ